ncbi:BEN domain-containing protein 2 [Heterocephalus glaber]|uniref:BEN domain-containing protein 2 n=1 Tax=Heterocephalus glaber TaxID=10181 RepID=A0AAX6RZ66_HETGA|nr:BEN domain-containing protein 2 [Heterocephalus glaber]
MAEDSHQDQDYIILTIGDSYDNIDDEDAVTKEDSETENSENPNDSDDALMIQSNFGSGSANFQQLFGMTYGVEGAEVHPDQLVSQMNHPTHLKRYRSEPTEQDFCSSNKKRLSSPPRQYNMERNVFEKFYDEYHRNQLRAFQQCFQGLQDLMEQTNRQVAKLNGIFSAMQQFWERSLIPQCPSVAASTEVPPPGYPSVANSPDRVNYSDILRNGSMSPETTLPSSVFILSHFDMPGIAEASLENNPETRDYPPVMDNDNSQHLLSSSANSSSDSDKKFILIEMPANMENSSEDSPEIESHPSSLENDRDQSPSSSFYFICTNCGMLSKQETGLERSPQTTNNLPFVEYESDISPYSSMSKTSVKTGTNMENNCGLKNCPNLLRNYGGQHHSSSSVSRCFHFGYFGNPSRHIKIPNSVIDIAKSKRCPEESAKYLLHHLFTEDVLIRSNVYGSLEQGLCALDSNRINAIREFLQDNFSAYDLEETGCDWQLCVIAINSYLHSFRSDFEDSRVKVQKRLSSVNPST